MDVSEVDSFIGIFQQLSLAGISASLNLGKSYLTGQSRQIIASLTGQSRQIIASLTGQSCQIICYLTGPYKQGSHP